MFAFVTMSCRVVLLVTCFNNPFLRRFFAVELYKFGFQMYEKVNILVLD